MHSTGAYLLITLISGCGLCTVLVTVGVCVCVCVQSCKGL